MSLPIFSVVIPTYNRALGLRRALNSLKSQTLQNFEVLVCDDGSTDNSKEIAEEFTKSLNINYLFEKNWGGPARPRNRGIENAKAEWVCFLDSDDWWYPKKLELVYKSITDSADVVFHDVDICNESQTVLRKKSYGKDLHPPIFVDLMVRSNLIHNSSVAVRKSILAKVGGLAEDKNLISVEDFDLWLRIAKVTDRFCRIPQSLGAYCVGSENISTVTEAQVMRAREAFSRHFSELTPHDQKRSQQIQNYIFGKMFFSMGKIPQASRYFTQASCGPFGETQLKSIYWLSKSQISFLKNKSQ